MTILANHHLTGKLGEQIAVDYLLQHGYTILAQNWRFHRAEIDVIAKKDDVLVFIEVKTRKSKAFGPPEAFVSKYKEQLIIDAASAYMDEIGHDWEIRFDIIGILLQSPPIISHIPDAFFPGV